MAMKSMFQVYLYCLGGSLLFCSNHMLLRNFSLMCLQVLMASLPSSIFLSIQSIIVRLV